jgi:hypothetical protein
MIYGSSNSDKQEDRKEIYREGREYMKKRIEGTYKKRPY